MTVIAGYTDGKTIAIAGDSGAFEQSGLYQITLEPKVWQAGESLVGVSGSFHVMEVARKSGLGDPYALRNHLKEANVIGEWSVLAVTKKAIYEIDEEFGVVKFKENYCAIGAGNAVCIGALAILHENKVAPDLAVRLALKVSGKHSNFAMPPFIVLKA